MSGVCMYCDIVRRNEVLAGSEDALKMTDGQTMSIPVIAQYPVHSIQCTVFSEQYPVHSAPNTNSPVLANLIRFVRR
jgi:hypothetical protein